MTSVGRRLWADGRNVLEGTKGMESKPFHFCIEGELENMSTITATVSLIVNAASKALAFLVNPNPLLPETEGVLDPGQLLGTVSGGVPPYTFTAAGVPLGDTLRQQPNPDGITTDVMISGTPAAGDAASSPFTITLTVTDSAPTPAAVSKTITVTR